MSGWRSKGGAGDEQERKGSEIPVNVKVFTLDNALFVITVLIFTRYVGVLRDYVENNFVWFLVVVVLHFGAGILGCLRRRRCCYDAGELLEHCLPDLPLFMFVWNKVVIEGESKTLIFDNVQDIPSLP